MAEKRRVIKMPNPIKQSSEFIASERKMSKSKDGGKNNREKFKSLRQENDTCFLCKQEGHMKKPCSKYKQRLEKNDRGANSSS